MLLFPEVRKITSNRNFPTLCNDQSVRMIVHTSIGGNRVRIHLSNAIGATPVTIGSIHIANRNGQGSQIVADSDRTITFSGKKSISIQPGVIVVSDPIDLDIRPGADLAVSLFFPQDTGAPTNHLLGLHKAFISKGDTTSQAVLQNRSRQPLRICGSPVSMCRKPLLGRFLLWP